MTVRAKFKCTSISANSDGSSIVLHPVVGGSPENDSFFKYTPGGLINISTVNPEAAAQFVPGQSYYVDFTPVAA